MSELPEKEKKGTRVNSVVLLLITFALFFGFRPLFEMTPEGVATEILVAGLGALFVTLVTLILLERQADTQRRLNEVHAKHLDKLQRDTIAQQTAFQDKQKKNEYLHKKKVDAYLEVVEKTRQVIEDRKVTASQQDEVPFLLFGLMLVGTTTVIDRFREVASILMPSGEKSISAGAEEDETLLDDNALSLLRNKMVAFCEGCREDFGLDPMGELAGPLNELLKLSSDSGRAREPLQGGFDEWAARVPLASRDKLKQLLSALEVESGLTPKFTKTSISFGGKKESGTRKVVAYVSANQRRVTVSMGGVSKEFAKEHLTLLSESSAAQLQEWRGSFAVDVSLPWDQWREDSLSQIALIAKNFRLKRELN